MGGEKLTSKSCYRGSRQFARKQFTLVQLKLARTEYSFNRPINSRCLSPD